jgi:xylulokinase
VQALIALDIGTTRVKAALIERSGRILFEDSRQYSLSVTADRVEQEPEDWWTGSAAVLSSVARHAERGSVAALALTGQMQNLITLGSAGPTGRAILYSDMRAQEEAREVSRVIGAGELQRRTGNLQDASSLPAKILWLRAHDPRRFAESRKLLFGAHDYVAWKLAGVAATDFTTLSTTGLLDLAANAYAFDLTDSLGIPQSLFPGVVAADHVDGGLGENAARLLGLPSGIPVFHGAGDAGSTTVGAGAGIPGALSCYLGTSGWIAASSAGGCADPGTGIFNLRHPDGVSLIHVGPMLLATGNVDWTIETLEKPLAGRAAGIDSADRYASFTREAGSAPAGSGRLLYLPWLVGERSPFRDPAARGAFFGLSRATTRAEMHRAVLEGVAFAMKSIHEAMPAEDGVRVRRLSLSGGGARSPLWPHVFADVFGCEVTVSERASIAGLIGAFVIAARGLGWLDGWLPPQECMGRETVFRPRAENQAVYDRQYGVFRGLYPALRGSFAALAKLDSTDRSGTDSRT